jgi:hypothetical protein
MNQSLDRLCSTHLQLERIRGNGGTLYRHHLGRNCCDRLLLSAMAAWWWKIHDPMTHAVVHVSFKIDPTLLVSRAWEIIAVDATGPGLETTLTARLTGDMDTLIKHLSRFPVADMALLNPSLQDIFLHYYQEDN